jgi:hypothetical protein
VAARTLQPQRVAYATCATPVALGNDRNSNPVSPKQKAPRLVGVALSGIYRQGIEREQTRDAADDAQASQGYAAR